MRMWLKITLIILSLLLVSCKFGISTAHSPDAAMNEGVEKAREKLKEAYNITVYAERMGTEVSEAVKKLNYALDYITQAEKSIANGNLEQATALTNASLQLSEETITLVQELKKQTEAWRYTRLIMSGVALVVIFGLCAGAFLLGWRIWKKSQEKKSSDRTLVNLRSDTNEEKTILVVVLSALIIIAGLSVYVLLTPAPQKNFVSIYLLNSEGRAENLPQLLVLNKNNTFSLLVGVENFMDRIEYCVVQVKIVNQTILKEPQPEETVMRFEKILLNGETWEFPVTMTLNKTGAYRINFELWLYNEMKSVFTYSNRWSSLYLEVVAET